MATGRRFPRSWPILPINFHALSHVIQRLAEEQWKHAPGGPMPALAVDDWGLLRSALMQPYQTAGGRPLYPALIPKAAVLFRGLVKNHGLVDGNKRMGVTATGVFLLINGYDVHFTQKELRDYALEVAGHAGNYPVSRIENWLRARVSLRPKAVLEKERQELIATFGSMDLVTVLLVAEPAPRGS